MSQPSNEARINLALQALQNDPKLTVRRAATIFDVNRSTLGRRQRGNQSRRDIMPNSQKLSNLEENVLLQSILDQISRGFPPQLCIIEEMANRLLADRDALPVGKHWAINFINRQPELKTRYSRGYDYQRALCEDLTIIRNWFRLVENTIAKYGILEDDIWNFDETGFMMGIIRTSKVVTSTQTQGRPKSVQPGNREWVTIIQGVNSTGWAIPPFIIAAGKKHLRSWYEDSNLPADWAIGMTPNGWTNNETGLIWLKHFNEHTVNRSVGFYRLLILDGHKGINQPTSKHIARKIRLLRFVCLLIPLSYSNLLMLGALGR
jgi:hypothetical protein